MSEANALAAAKQSLWPGFSHHVDCHIAAAPRNDLLIRVYPYDKNQGNGANNHLEFVVIFNSIQKEIS
jgi:hypothetical protein